MPPIHLVLGASKQLARLFFILHGGAALMMLWAWIGGQLPFLLILINLLALLLSWAHCLEKHAFRTHQQAIKELRCDPRQAAWVVLLNNGQQYLLHLSGDSTLTFGISLLKFKQRGCFLNRVALIYQDALDKESYRQLRKWWRYYGQTSRSL